MNTAAGTRVRITARPLVTGTFVRSYAPLPSGKVNVEVRWDDATLYMPAILSTQIESL